MKRITTDDIKYYIVYLICHEIYDITWLIDAIDAIDVVSNSYPPWN